MGEMCVCGSKRNGWLCNLDFNALLKFHVTPFALPAIRQRKRQSTQASKQKKTKLFMVQRIIARVVIDLRLIFGTIDTM